VPFLIMQGALDDNVLPAIQKEFVKTYRAAGAIVNSRSKTQNTIEFVTVTV
jgi:hypothetical protein